MVKLTSASCAQMKTFCKMMRGKKYNHRKPIQYQRFMDHIDREKIVSHYSRDDINDINPREGIRTYKDAQLSLGRQNYLLPNLTDQDLELNDIFQKELDRQRAIVARINKIRVVVDSMPGKGTELLMNKSLSTPFDCARHVHDMLTTRSVVAELLPLDENIQQIEGPVDDTITKADQKVDNDNDITASSSKNQLQKKQPTKPRSVYWDMHKPLEESCKLRFRHFTDDNLGEVNKIYWRSCSFVLGMAIRQAFKEEVKVALHSWPKPNIKSGSFVYDVALNLSDKWLPGEQELRAFTKVMWGIKNAALPFEQLQVNREVAIRLFSTNPFKLTQIDSILSDQTSQGKVTVYRCGGLLDISIGPMISNTSQIGRISLASVHPFESESSAFKGIFYRFQGVSLPQQLPISSYVYQNILLDRARKLNKVAL